MTADRLEYAIALLEKLVAMQGGGTVPSPGQPTYPPERTNTIGPGRVTIGGANLNLMAPIAMDWEPSAEARTFTQHYGGVGAEPSNGDGSPTFPLRSPNSYPMVYGVDGLRNLLLPGRIKFGGDTFRDEAELAEHRQRAADRVIYR